ncbi:hypothetical protein BAR24066_05724 [Burkholderia arboris]|uniref:Uncharacterized protein n=1 Tax=Burkholderia arboris TaxID=488730 RepID=A0A9Q9UTP8_9BURK|nr:hypothetical protein BAR24066_05724 [Burkholderia arboris]
MSGRRARRRRDRRSSPRLHIFVSMASSCFEFLSEISTIPSGHHRSAYRRLFTRDGTDASPRPIGATSHAAVRAELSLYKFANGRRMDSLTDSLPIPAPLKARPPPNVIGPLIETAQCGRARHASPPYTKRLIDTCLQGMSVLDSASRSLPLSILLLRPRRRHRLEHAWRMACRHRRETGHEQERPVEVNSTRWFWRHRAVPAV